MVTSYPGNQYYQPFLYHASGEEVMSTQRGEDLRSHSLGANRIER